MQLTDYGFVPVGDWTLRPAIKSGIAYNLRAMAEDRVIYAFVVDGKPQYIGICEKDTTTLRERMERYKNQQGAGTNLRISIEIRLRLDQQQAVEIFALAPTASHSFLDLSIDLVKGLENPLIAHFKPSWNRLGS